MNEKNSSIQAVSLKRLAEQINAEHQAAESAWRRGLPHALRAGELLTQAKEQCPHGTWLKWVGDNFSGTIRTMQLYVQLAEGRGQLESNAQSIAHLTITDAMHLLAEPKPKARLLESLDLFADITALVDQADVDRLMALLRPGMLKGYWPIIDFHAGSGFWLFHTLTTPDGLASMKPSRLMVRLQELGVTCENMDEAVQTIANLRDSGSWKPEAATWEDYCADHFGEPAWVDAVIASVQSLEVAA